MTSLRDRIGLSIETHAIRAVSVRRGQVRWRETWPWEDGTPLADALTPALQSMPRRWRSPALSIAIGTPWCQLKPLEALPATADLRHLTHAVQSNASAFFLHSARLAIAPLCRRTDGSLWAAAFDETLLVDVVRTLRALGITRMRMLPTVHVIACLLEPGTHRVADGLGATQLDVDHARIVAIRRARSNDQTEIRLLPSAARRLDNPAFAGAYGAVLAPPNADFLWRPAPEPQRAARTRRLALTAGTVLTGAALLAAITAPALRAHLFVAQTMAARTHLLPRSRDALRLGSDLRTVTTSLDRIHRLSRGRGQLTTTLGALSAALPESSAVVSIRLDSLDGSVVILASDIGDALQHLLTVHGLSDAHVVGSVTRETMGAASLERATIRFRRSTVAP